MLNMNMMIEQTRYKVIEILVNSYQWEYIDEMKEYLSDNRLKELLDKTVKDIDLWLNARDMQVEFVVFIIDDKIYVSKYVAQPGCHVGGVLK